MEKEHILKVAETIRLQISATAAPNVIGSWGASDPVATVFNDQPAMAFIADARLFRGVVLVALTPADLYDLWLVTPESRRQVSAGLCADRLTDAIDTAIERGEDPEEYERFCREQARLLIDTAVIV